MGSMMFTYLSQYSTISTNLTYVNLVTSVREDSVSCSGSDI